MDKESMFTLFDGIRYVYPCTISLHLISRRPWSVQVVHIFALFTSFSFYKFTTVLQFFHCDNQQNCNWKSAWNDVVVKTAQKPFISNVVRNRFIVWRKASGDFSISAALLLVTSSFSHLWLLQCRNFIIDCNFKSIAKHWKETRSTVLQLNSTWPFLFYQGLIDFTGEFSLPLPKSSRRHR